MKWLYYISRTDDGRLMEIVRRDSRNGIPGPIIESLNPDDVTRLPTTSTPPFLSTIRSTSSCPVAIGSSGAGRFASPT